MVRLAVHDRVSGLLDSTVASVKEVLHVPLHIEEAHAYSETALISEICVLVSFVGEMEGRMLIHGDKQTFVNLAATMYGVNLEGEILHSFVGELANMLAGNICSFISRKSTNVDITTPTILMGELKLYNYKNGYSITVDVHDVGEISIILLVQEGKAE
jgi:chemotaxis protein CheX